VFIAGLFFPSRQRMAAAQASFVLSTK